MPISLLLVFLVAISGMILTYLVAQDRPLLWRLAVGNIVGSAVWGMVVFILGFLGGFTTGTVGVSLLITLLPCALLLRPDIRSRFDRDVTRARGKLQGANSTKGLVFVYYLFFFGLFCLYFSNAIYQLKDGIYTGGSQNLGDLPFHLGAIFSFTDGANFPPQNPSWAGAKFSYPFMSDLLTACLVKLGSPVDRAIVVQDVSWAFSLLVILQSFTTKITGSKLAGRIAPALLIFSGGLSFVLAIRDFYDNGKELTDFLWHIPRDYTINDNYRWGNSMIVLFMTQRSILLGMPLTIIVLDYLWKIFTGEERETKKFSLNEFLSRSQFPISAFLVGLLAGTLVLIHLHSLVTLFLITAFLFIFKPQKWSDWIAFGVGTALVAVPELIWSIVGSATETSKFVGWEWGWDKGDKNFLWFWFTNTGLLFPMLAAGLWLILRKRPEDEHPERSKRHENDLTLLVDTGKEHDLALFYIPFALLFVVCNVSKFAPWVWDNIKVLIYWYIGTLPIVALAIAWLWTKRTPGKIAAAACFVVLIFSGAIDVWRASTGQVKIRVFETDAMTLAEQIKQKTDPHAIFLNAPTYNSAVVLSGRQSLMRYSGHLSSYGIDYFPRETDVKHIYEGGGVSDMLLKNYNIDYVLISPEERNTLKANEDFFKKYPVVAEAGQYKVYKVK